MKKLFPALACLALLAASAAAQKGKAESDYYPMGYAGDTWTGEVVAVDNAARTLTLKSVKGKDEQTFVATLPDAPYQWTKDGRGSRVLDFPYDKKSTHQVFKYQGSGEAPGSLLPDSGVPTAAEGASAGMQQRPNPPDSNRIDDLSDFKGRRVTVYYTARERAEGGATVKYNDVWRVRVSPKK